MNKDDSSRQVEIEVFVVEEIVNCPLLPPSKEIIQMAQEKNLDLSDKGELENLEILVGANYLSKVLTGKSHRAGKNLLFVNTIFGASVLGCLDAPDTTCNAVSANLVIATENDLISQQLQNLWNLESIGIQPDKETAAVDKEIMEYFERNTKFKDDRYETRLLWKSERENLRNNFDIAKKRLINLRNKFDKDSELFHKYNDVITDQLKEGIIEECKLDTSSDNVNYIPFRAVIREDKTTSKVRLVYNASLKNRDQISINDQLLSGPALNPDLLALILNFRIYCIGFCADIEAAYHRISIAEEDRDFLRFLWFDKNKDDQLNNKNLKVYRFTRVPFGVKCSSFLLTATIRLHLKAYEKVNKQACEMLKQLYVDDVIQGSDSILDAFNVSVAAKNILGEANMRLRKWETNSCELKDLWSTENFDIRPPDKNSTALKVLGLKWENEHDLLKLDLKSLIDSLEIPEHTKRGVLKIVAKLFDPLGLVNPFTIRMKCLLQELWIRGLSWDQNLPPDLNLKWCEWIRELNELSCLEIPRSYFGFKIADLNVQLCIFCDASLLAYGIVVYLRVKNGDQYQTKFVLSKSRVAPLKRITLPRLELMGAVLAARIAHYLKDNLNLKLDSIIFFTDSEICLHWIKGSSKKWKPFVANRILEIQSKTDPQNWNYCKSKENPADMVTRGLKPSDFITNKIWWEGPNWLSNTAHSFRPISSIDLNDSEISSEIKKDCVSVNVVEGFNPQNEILTKFSSWNKLRKVIAYCLRFRKIPVSRLGKIISLEELNEATFVILRLVQQEHFSSEIKQLKESKSINSSSKLLSLNPFLDENNLLRVGGRLKNSNLSNDEKHPIILPTDHHVTKLIIQFYHEIHLHGGLLLLHSSIRHKYWILNAKNAIRKCLFKCIKCCRYRLTSTKQIMSDLPKSRVTPSRAFSKIGVDFAGPFFVKMRKGRGVRPTKCYACIFVCFATKAIHIEIASDLSTDTFIAALRRFTARRGKPVEIHSDNGTNFIGANKELNNVLCSLKISDEFHHYTNNEGIKWLFNPPLGSHHGGLWEAAVKQMKYHLRRVIGAQILTHEEFLTLVTQIEACLNSRPLTPVSSDPSDFSALTPGHFLIGDPLTAIPEKNLLEEKISTVKRWQLTQQMFQSFWKRWSKEYLSMLQNRNKWQKSQHNLRLNDLVYLKEDNQPPLKWKLGRIVELYPGSDNKVRIVKVKTQHGEFKRPITKLSPLPFNEH